MKPGTKQGPNLEARRSHVRVIVTYGAAGFLFIGGAALIIVFLMAKGDTQTSGFTEAKDLFTTISPIATGIVTYWFASRSVEKNSKPNGEQNNDNGDN